MFGFAGDNLFWRLTLSDPGLGSVAEAHHNLLLVFVSLFIAVLGGFSALTILDRMRVLDRFDSKWWTWLGIGALTLGIGVWSMHFTGMIAYEIPLDVNFTLALTAVSVIPAVIGGGIAMYYMSYSQVEIDVYTYNLASLFLAVGIGSMHYIGMEAMVLKGHLRYDSSLFLLSIVVAFILGLVAFVSKFQLVSDDDTSAYQVDLSTWGYRSVSALFIGLAISGMHYTAMAATRVYPDPSLTLDGGMGFSREVLGFTIGGFSTLYLTGVIIAVQISKNVAVRSIITDQAEAIARGDFQAESLETDLGGRLGRAFNSMIDDLRISSKQADAIAHGQLSADVLDKDVSGDFGDSFKRMLNQLTELINNLKKSIDQLESVSSDIRSTSAELRDSSRSLSNTANEAAQAADEGKEMMNQLAQTVEQLSQESDRIQDAIGVIDEITFQTKILSLNAAVEAARAGEEGSGFAVVAEEVQQLSERTADAADKISDTIERSVERTETGAEQARKSQDVLDAINNQIKQLDSRMKEISRSDDKAIQAKHSSNSNNDGRPLTNSLANQAESLETVVETLSEAVDEFTLD